MKKLFLFDMDGTLTPARSKMSWAMEAALTELQKSGWEIGIISGSDLEYINQQCAILLDISAFNSRAAHFLPCNGTKYYKNFKKIWAYSIKDVITQNNINILMKCIFKEQRKIIKKYDIPLTGNFIQQRGSMINWCPIGRNANQVERKIWTCLDVENNIRLAILEKLKKCIKDIDITVKLGGETSFDIYPKGWNKTFPLDKHPFVDYRKIYFAGDRCNDNGNDKELYNLLKNKNNCSAFSINNPAEVIKLINEVIKENK
jgi:phosphomannomutase